MMVQWKLLNVIALGQCHSDNINQMITVADSINIDFGPCYVDHLDRISDHNYVASTLL
jgi:hypothetical protein